MFSSCTSGKRQRLTRFIGQPVTGMHFQAPVDGQSGHLAKRSSALGHGLERPSAIGIAIGAGVQLDHFGTDAVGGLDLALLSRNKDRDAASCLAQWGDEMGQLFSSRATSSPPSVVRSSRFSGTMHTACGL